MKLFTLMALVVLGLTVKPLNCEAEGQKKGNYLVKEGQQWSGKMQELYRTLADLLTDVTSDARFLDPANKKRIELEAGKLASLTHDLKKKGMVSLDKDPTISIVAEQLGSETKRAVAELKRGNRGYARAILRSIPSYCIACHTRNSSGPQFSQLPIEPTSKTLTSLERGEFLVATRQFDRAQQEFMKVIQDPKMASAFNFDWERAIRHSLAIAVRVKQDPMRAQEVIESILNMKNAPSAISHDAKAWKASVQEWKEEPHRQAMTEEGLHSEALRLMAKARDMQKYPMDRTADILYLRASAAAHNLLQVPKGSRASEGLLLAGLSYEVLSPLKIDALHDLYYEACVRAAPHTLTAELCYRRYEQSMVLGYTGSSGTDVPDDIRKKLFELRNLAKPAGASATELQ